MNIYNYITPETGETFTTLLEHKNVKINRIVSSNDLEPVEYIQKEDEWVIVFEGEALLLLEDKKITLKKGDTLFIPAHTPHSVLETLQSTIWLTVHIY